MTIDINKVRVQLDDFVKDWREALAKATEVKS